LDIRKPFLKCTGVARGTFKIAVGRFGDVAIRSQQVLNPQLATSVDEVPAGRKSVGQHRREGGRKETPDDRESNGHRDPIISLASRVRIAHLVRSGTGIMRRYSNPEVRAQLDRLNLG
jgi:hypothetical protein